jgi:transposase-like protein
MSIVVLKLPAVKRKIEERPKKCAACAGETFQRWGQVNKLVKDTRIRKVKVYRYRCCRCKQTFRHYPEGVTQAQQSERLMKLCVIMWSLGLSYRSMVMILAVFGVNLSHMSGWRDVQEAGRQIRRRLKWKAARVVGVDGAWINGKGVMVAVDLGDGELLSIAEIDEKEKAKLQAWLKILKQKHNIGAIVTDDLATYKEIVEELELGHQVCQFHVRRWVGRALKNLEEEIPPEWLYVILEIRKLIDQLPDNGDKLLYDIWKEMPGRTTKPNEERTPLEKLRDIVLRLSQDWHSYIAFYDDPGIPWTNNRTEQIIGRLKSRAKRVRGYKSSDGLLAGSLVACQCWI